MLCKKPFRKANLSFGCGQCTHCRINRVRLWVGRMLLESYEHPVSAFLTLTYDQQNLPSPPQVSKREIQLFMKKLRAYSGREYRYYAVGEYGDKTWRPHYHLIVYGLNPTENALVEKCWKKGFVYYGLVTDSSCSYVSSYVIKRMTKKTDPRLGGLNPEFALMSRRPALGSQIVERITSAYHSEKGLAAFEKQRRVQTEFRADGKVYSIGSYLTKKLHTNLGIEKADRALYTAQRSREIWEEQRTLTATEIDAKFKAKLAQQNAKIRQKRKIL